MSSANLRLYYQPIWPAIFAHPYFYDCYWILRWIKLIISVDLIARRSICVSNKLNGLVKRLGLHYLSQFSLSHNKNTIAIRALSNSWISPVERWTIQSRKLGLGSGKRKRKAVLATAAFWHAAMQGLLYHHRNLPLLYSCKLCMLHRLNFGIG